MDSRDWSKIESHFFELISLDENEQQSYLEKIKTEDAQLHGTLEHLLAEEKNPHPLLSHSGAKMVNQLDEQNLVGNHIGIYKIEKHLGSGAFASVYLAQRDDGEFEQKVALKIIHQNIFQDNSVELFKRERQVLASLQHANIAQLFDGGVTDEGTPYFTMEYIEGHSYLQHCLQLQLNLNARLELFLQICKAVKYAHNRLIAHLDLKPGNIMVDKEEQLKVLDFGIARIMELQEEADTTNEYTRFTMAYASPEQIQSREVSTSSDIYSLGVILQELIVGEHPFQQFFSEPRALKRAILNGEKVPLLKNYRKLLPSQIKVTRDLYELEAIWKHAMALKPTDRYDSVDALMDDINAFRGKYPVKVVSRSQLYLTRKFWQRNKKVLTAVFTGLLVLVTTIFVYTNQLKQQRNRATSEALKAEKVTELLTDIFKNADPYQVNGDTVTAVQLLEAGLQKLDNTLQNQPEIKASLLHEMVSIFQGLGKFQLSDSLSQVAFRLTDSLYQEPHAGIARSYLEMGGVKLLDFELDTALYLLNKSFQNYSQLREQDEGILNRILKDIGNVYYSQDEFEKADSVFTRIYDYHQKQYEPPHPELADDLQMLGAIHRKLRNYDISEQYYLRSLAMKEELYEAPHHELAYTLNHLSSLKQNMGQMEEAIPYAEKALQQREAVLGVYHMETTASRSNLARVHRHLKNYAVALPLYLVVDTSFQQLFPYGHPYQAVTWQNIAGVYRQIQRLDSSEFYLRKSLELERRIMADDHLHLSQSLCRLAEVMLQQNKNRGETKEILNEALEYRLANLPENDDKVIETQELLADYYLAIYDYKNAITVLEKAYLSCNDKGEEHVLRASIIKKLTRAHQLSGNQERADFYQKMISEG